MSLRRESIKNKKQLKALLSAIKEDADERIYLLSRLLAEGQLPLLRRIHSAVFKEVGLPLQEMDDWNCCGATAYFSVDDTMAAAVCGRISPWRKNVGRISSSLCRLFPDFEKMKRVSGPAVSRNRTNFKALKRRRLRIPGFRQGPNIR